MKDDSRQGNPAWNAERRLPLAWIDSWGVKRRTSAVSPLIQHPPTERNFLKSSTVSLESPDQPEVIALIEALADYQIPLYPAESHHGIDINALASDNTVFSVARAIDGTAVACGALVVHATHGELKRMFTQPASRGQGLAGRILSVLEDEARRRGCARVMLETGYLQHEAISFYERNGYQRRGPFGDYQEDPNSVFMEKHFPD
ncbi:GNAT family N-acetyltransferase [Pseudomonas graminis]|uniref:GNAT family N-acetyltransferase n=1 Tax=Pseudomonas graminis TaxID=158627 RepID=UPI002349B9D7|nr:GNAT family N-acetyltransferase [Pseudomonas graminis]MDC6383616.1 GNAT family N-acetyltransferase [Pseudomonas graminis]